VRSPAVAFLTTDFSPTTPLQPGGCAWYRCYLPSREIEKRGINSAIGIPYYELPHGLGIKVDGERAVMGWGVVVMKLLMRTETPSQIESVKQLNQLVVVDIDDFYPGLQPDNQAYHYTDPANNPQNNREHYYKVIERADVLTVSTQFLLDYYSKRHPNVFMVRNGIDFARYTRRKDQAGDKPVIGWVGATPWRTNDLETLAEILPAFVERHDLRCHHSGFKEGFASFSDLTGVDPERVSSQGMQPIMGYPSMFKPIDVGLVPLSFNDFNEAKSCLKGLEYAAAGIPFVAAATHEYQLLAEQGVGRVARTPEDWERHLTELIDPKVRKREAAINRAKVSKLQSMNVRGKEWHDLMTALIAS